MGKIATHPLTLCIHFHSRDRKCARSGCVAYRFPDPVADALHLIVAELHASDDVAREIAEASEDIAGQADEGLTWRLRQAAEGQTEALRGRGEDRTEYVVAENGLPASSVPDTVTSKLVSAARSAPATATEKVLSAATVPE